MSGPRIRIDRDASIPPAAQIADGLRRRIDAGRLAPGARVPTVRAFAAQLGVVPNTVAKAYRELEAAGYLEGRGRAGTFVALAAPVPGGDPGAALETAAERFARRARELGFGPREAAAAVRRALG